MGVRQINSGIDRKRIIEYLEVELGIIPESDGGYVLPGCVITLTPLINDTSVLRIPRTLVTFTGDDEACTAHQKAFRLRFLSAGG